MKLTVHSARQGSSLDMTRTDEPSAGFDRRLYTDHSTADAYLMTSPTYFLQYRGDKWDIKPNDTVTLVDQSARNAVVSVKHDEHDKASRLFYLTHHPTEAWHVTEVFSPPSERQ
ncbi:MAG: hypothetical protein J6B02_01200 [Selenomonadales bacterium]|nr:hypothetical protein [Selenomonadales bacterium]